MTKDEKTLSMKLTFTLLNMEGLVGDIRRDCENAGPQTKKYYTYFANLIETRLKLIKHTLEKIEYLEVK